MRVAIKALVTVYGLALFGAFRRGGELLALERTAYSLWCFFGVTLWTNFISVCFVPFNFRESVQTARRIQEEQEADAGTRPLSTQLSSQRRHHPAQQYAKNFAQRSISSGYHVESPEDFRTAAGGGEEGVARGSEQSSDPDQDPYAAAARFA